MFIEAIQEDSVSTKRTHKRVSIYAEQRNWGNTYHEETGSYSRNKITFHFTADIGAGVTGLFDCVMVLRQRVRFPPRTLLPAHFMFSLDTHPFCGWTWNCPSCFSISSELLLFVLKKINSLCFNNVSFWNCDFLYHRVDSFADEKKILSINTRDVKGVLMSEYWYCYSCEYALYRKTTATITDAIVEGISKKLVRKLCETLLSA